MFLVLLSSLKRPPLLTSCLYGTWIADYSSLNFFFNQNIWPFYFFFKTLSSYWTLFYSIQFVLYTQKKKTKKTFVWQTTKKYMYSSSKIHKLFMHANHVLLRLSILASSRMCKVCAWVFKENYDAGAKGQRRTNERTNVSYVIDSCPEKQNIGIENYAQF